MLRSTPNTQHPLKCAVTQLCLGNQQQHVDAGIKHPLDAVTEEQKYTLAGVARRIKGDVLVLAGTEDHFVPIEQVAQFEKALTAARSVTTKIYDRASGGAEHC